MIEIRPYQEEDFDEICSWWIEHKEFAPLPGMMTEEGTFVLEYEGKPILTLSVLMTQSKEIAYFEGYCAKPGIEKQLRNDLGEILFEHAYEFLRNRGFKRVIIFTDKPSLVHRYEELGMVKNMNGLYAMGRVL